MQHYVYTYLFQMSNKMCYQMKLCDENSHVKMLAAQFEVCKQ